MSNGIVVAHDFSDADYRATPRALREREFMIGGRPVRCRAGR